jgi:hypothetical protein
MPRWPWIVLVVAVVIVALWLRPRPTPPAPGTNDTSAEHRRNEPGTGTPTPAQRRAVVRTMVPRLVTPPAAVDAGAAEPRHPPRLERGSGNLTDKRSNPTGNPKLLRAQLQERIKLADENAQKCLEDWGERDPALEKGVMLAFTLDAQGLQEVWIEDHPEVPQGALACLSNALYPLDWSGLTTEPLQVTRKLRYARDAGP